jgi:hypothetical protein
VSGAHIVRQNRLVTFVGSGKSRVVPIFKGGSLGLRV